MKKLTLVIAALVAVAIGALPAQAGTPASVLTVVSHGDTHTDYFGDDICGDRASWVTFTLRTTVLHITERGGLYSIKYNETGTYHVDFDDPALADQDSQFTEAVHFVVTPGETVVLSVAFHDFPTGIRIWERVHVTVVKGTPVVEREILKVTGCP